MEYPLSQFYQMIYTFQNDFALWILLLAVVFGFVLAFAVGANDSANSWGTPIGSGTVSLGVAVLLGSIMETLGAMFLSAEVVKTVAGGSSVVKIALYQSDNETEWTHFMSGQDYLIKEKTLMLGLLTSMLASQIWQLMACYMAWPVSGLFLSPPLAFVVAFLLYYAVYKFSIKSGTPTKLRNRLCYTFCVFLMFMAVGFTMATAKSVKQPFILESTSCMHPNKNLFGLLVGLGTGLLAAVPFYFIVLPTLLKSKRDLRVTLSFCSNIFSKTKENETQDYTSLQMNDVDNSKDAKKNYGNVSDESVKEAEEVKNVFRPLQLIVACFAALNHGGNDVGNCIGPLVTIWFMYKSPIAYSLDETAYEWLLWGGLGISLGLVMFGERVIKTMGTKITPMTPSLGFVVVLSASLVVMLCSLLGIPTSTTQCQVMAVVGAGVARGALDHDSFKRGLLTVDFKVFRNIGLSWLCTIPFSMAISAGLYAAVRTLVIGTLR